MGKKIIPCILLLTLIMVSLAGAQLKTQKSNVFKPSSLAQRPKGFLDALVDPSKFSMSHSYSLSLFSVGNRSFNQGLYLNTLNYQFSNPLRMQLRIGFLHQPLGGSGMTSQQNGKVFVQRALIEYKPSKNFSLSVDYQSYPSSMYYSPYRYRR